MFEMKIFHQIYRYLITQVTTMSSGRKGLSLTHPIHMFPIRADPDILSGLMLSVTLPNGYMNVMSGGIITTYEIVVEIFDGPTFPLPKIPQGQPLFFKCFFVTIFKNTYGD